MPSVISTDVLIVGAGVAGLWLNARLRRQGFSTVLVESASLGGGQSVKSQGIIHGGAKYALHGALTGASEAIADMPRRWREALAGDGELDLSGVRLLSEAHYLWSPGTIAGNLTSFFASKAVRGRVDQVKGEQLPPALQDKRFKGKVYRLAELVIDVPSLIQRLADLAGDGLLAGQKIEPLLEGGVLVGLKVDEREIRAQRIVLSAGGGTAALLEALGLSQPAMQRRPLHMIIAKGPSLKPLYAHCLGGGTKPRITVTTHPAADGQWVWYLGGDIAEAEGVAREPAEQIATAQKELGQLLPWIDLSTVQWATLRVDRAEPLQSGLTRPDNAFLAEEGRLLVGWPTKLALAPDFADRVIASLARDGIQPGPAAPLPRTAKAADGRPGLGATAAMSQPTLHDLHRPLGSTGLLVSPLGLGTVKLGRDQGVKYPNGFQIPDDDEARMLLKLARDLGINLIDTAPAYGRSEERLGPLLRGQRQDWVIVSKVGEEFADGQSRHDFSAAHTRLSVERSLQRLETDFIDLVLVHSDGNDLAILNDCEVYATLAELKAEGKIRGFGFSGKTVEGGLKALEQGDCAMVTYNLNEQTEKAVIDYAAAHGKAILVKKALASGHVCLSPGVDPVRASFELLFEHPGVASAIVGTINPLHLAHNVATVAQVLRSN